MKSITSSYAFNLGLGLIKMYVVAVIVDAVIKGVQSARA